MLTRPRLFIILALVLVLIPGLLLAAVQGRVFGVVTDESEQPVAGLTITVTDPERVTVKVVAETDENGEYTVTLPDATHTYTYTLTKQGYEPFETSFKVPAGSTRAMNFTVVQGSVMAPDVFNEGNVAAREGDYALAVERYREALELDPSLVPAHAALATVLLLAKDLEGAISAAEAGLAIDPVNHRLLTVRYEALKASGDKEGAAAALATLQAVDPERAASDLVKRAGSLFEAGQIGEARELLEQALEADPEIAKAYYLMGLCLLNAGDSAGAKEHLAKFVEMAPDDPDVAAAQGMLEYLE
jgi:tetratricopeptide (TPR) repeat protein